MACVMKYPFKDIMPGSNVNINIIVQYLVCHSNWYFFVAIPTIVQSYVLLTNFHHSAIFSSVT